MVKIKHLRLNVPCIRRECCWRLIWFIRLLAFIITTHDGSLLTKLAPHVAFSMLPLPCISIIDTEKFLLYCRYCQLDLEFAYVHMTSNAGPRFLGWAYWCLLKMRIFFCWLCHFYPKVHTIFSYAKMNIYRCWMGHLKSIIIWRKGLRIYVQKLNS